MDNYLNEIRDSALSFQSAVEEKEQAEIQLKQKFRGGDLALNEYNAQLQELKEQSDESFRQSRSTIEEVVSKYQVDLNAWATLKVEDITDDINLLNSPISLDSSDYEKLEETYQNNFSMLKAIQSHAKKNNVSYSENYLADKERKLEEINSFAQDAHNIIHQSQTQGKPVYMGVLWSDEERFKNLTENAARLTQIGKAKRKIISSDGTVTWK